MAVRELIVPGGREPAAWLEGIAPEPPVVVPRWPASARKVLVVVVRAHDDMTRDSPTAAYVVTTPDEMADLYNTDTRRQQWFVVARAAIQAACPGLNTTDQE